MNWLKIKEDTNDKILYILRSVSGAGKTTTAKALVNNDVSKIFSTDDFFYLEPQPGPYDFRHPEVYDHEVYKRNWTATKLHAAHQWNIRRVEDAMNKGISPIVVDNTNLQQRDAKPYAELAQKHNYLTEIKEPESPEWKEVVPLLQNKAANAEAINVYANKFTRNLHGVPKDTIVKMLHKYQPYTVQDLTK